MLVPLSDHLFRKRIRGLKPRIIASSHRKVISGDRIPAELDRYEAVIAARSSKILKAIGKRPGTFAALLSTSPFYGGYPYAPNLLRYWEGLMIRKHLDELINQGLVWEEDDQIGLIRK